MSTAMRADNCPAARRAGARRDFLFDRDAREYDWLVVYHDLPGGGGGFERLRCPRENTVLVTHEPPAIKSYGRDFCAQFGRVLSCHDSRSLSHPRLIRTHPGSLWFYGIDFLDSRADGQDYDRLKNAPPPRKTRTLSTCCSDKKMRHTLHRCAATNSRADSRALCRRWIGSGAALTPSGKNPTPSILTAIIWRSKIKSARIIGPKKSPTRFWVARCRFIAERPIWRNTFRRKVLSPSIFSISKARWRQFNGQSPTANTKSACRTFSKRGGGFWKSTICMRCWRALSPIFPRRRNPKKGNRRASACDGRNDIEPPPFAAKKSARGGALSGRKMAQPRRFRFRFRAQQSTKLTGTSSAFVAKPPRAVSLYLLIISRPVSRIVLMTLSSDT